MPLSALDVSSVIWFLFLMMTFDVIAYHSRFAEYSLSASVSAQRRAWLEHMANRELRHFDAILLTSLSQSNAFFASTSVLGIGGLAAIMGSGDSPRRMLEKLPIVVETPASLWEIKILFLISILIYAFFKFVWAFRLSHYTAIMFGAMAEMGSADKATIKTHATHTARLLDLIGHHANSGLRSFYYAFAAISWLFHPVIFILASTLVFLILLRREFFSKAARIFNEAKATSFSKPTND